MQIIYYVELNLKITCLFVGAKLVVVNANGSADYAILAPRLKSISQIKHRALIIHEGGDNYSDHPETLGGGGLRVVCGIIK